MEQNARPVINMCAKTTGDSSKLAKCVQLENEPVPTFINRFSELWEQCMGSSPTENYVLATSMLLGNIRPSVAKTYQLASWALERQKWEEVVGGLIGMYEEGWFSLGKSGKTKNKLCSWHQKLSLLLKRLAERWHRA